MVARVTERHIPIVEISSPEGALNSLDTIAELFKSKGVLVIRGARLSVDEQISLTKSLGSIFSWSVYEGMHESGLTSAVHQGGHSDQENRDYIEGPNDYVLDWHIEQVYYIEPILAGVWNMELFTAPYGSGDTRFVDSIELFSLYDDEDKDFLFKSIVTWDKQTPHGPGPFFTKVVDKHPITGLPVLRVETDRGCSIMPKLALWDGKVPTYDQIARLEFLLSKLKDNLNNNLNIRYSQHWQEGDLLIVDLFRMYHAVMGGFKYGERKFTGIGIRPRVYGIDMYRSIESVKTNE